jgi:putative DNA primase/helicase
MRKKPQRPQAVRKKSQKQKNQPKKSSKVKSERKRAALRYAAAGFRVGPLHGMKNGLCTCGNPQCDRPGGHTRVRICDATSEPAIVAQYWDKWRAARIAIVTGVGNTIAVKVSGKAGRAALGGWSTGSTVEFKQGSERVYFFVVGDDEMPAGEIRLEEGVSVLGRNRFVAVPDDLPENDVDVAPDVLRHRLRARKPSVDTSRLSIGQGPVTGGDLVVTRAADIKPEAVSWLWPNRIARGSITLIAGRPGLGKSQIAATLAAKVSTGGKWPHKGSAPLGDVFMLIGEDDLATTVKPRLTAAKANSARIHLISISHTNSKSSNLLDKLDGLAITIEGTENPKLLIVDPISAFFGMHINDSTRVRDLLNRLNEMAKDYDMAVVLIGHLTKAGGPSALSTIGGSTAFAAAARAVHLVVPCEASSKRRIFVCAKNNLGTDDSALQFWIKREKVRGINSSRIAWHKDRLQMTADEALAKSKVNSAKSPQLRAVDELVKGLLTDGKRATAEIFAKGDESGFTPRQLRTAATRLTVVKSNTGFGPSKEWFWELPAAPKSS